MACTATTVVTSSYSKEEPAFSSSYGTFDTNSGEARRRRHSSYHVRPWHAEQENIQLLVENFLAELGKRLDFIESYGHLRIDEGIERAWTTLQAVRESCSHVSDEVLDAGWRRASILVNTLEARYKDVLATKDTLQEKVHTGVRLMENILEDFETRAYAIRDSTIGSVAQDIIDDGLRRMDISIGRAKEVVDEGYAKARRAKDRAKHRMSRKLESIEHAIEHALERAKTHGLIKYEDLPDPWRVNPHILRGYRFHEAKLDCVKSMLSISNELVNIWSHAIGFLIVLSVAFYFYPSSTNFSLSTNSDVFIAAVFFIAASKCLVCSTIWHTMSSISEQSLMERFACIDYTGISLLVAASIMTTEYAAFYCEPYSRWTYMLLTASLGVGGVVLPWRPVFNRSDMAWLRVVFYVTLGATGFLPIFQLIWTRGLFWAIYFYAPVTKSIVVYLIGAMLYAFKVPERWCPGMFDYVGGSHNLWHFAVVAGILFHYHAMQDMFSQALMRAQIHCSQY